jgi:hypothetical protein
MHRKIIAQTVIKAETKAKTKITTRKAFIFPKKIDISLFTMLALKAYRRNDYEEAVIFAREALKEPAHTADVFTSLILGKSLEAQNKLSEAIPILSKIESSYEDINTSDISVINTAYQARLKCSDKQYKSKGHRKALQQTKSRYINNTILKKAASLYDEALLMLQSGLNQLATPLLQEALNYINQAIHFNPRAGMAWAMKLQTVFNLNKFENCLEALENAHKYGAFSDNNYYLRLQDIGTKLGDPVLIEKALTGLRGHTSPQMLLTVQQNSIANKRNIKLLFKQADGHKAKQKYQHELLCYKQILKLDPQNIIALINQSGTFLRLQRHREALQALNTASRISPSEPVILQNYAAAHGSLGYQHFNQGEYEQAKESFKLFIKYYSLQKNTKIKLQLRTTLTFTQKKLKEIDIILKKREQLKASYYSKLAPVISKNDSTNETVLSFLSIDLSEELSLALELSESLQTSKVNTKELADNLALATELQTSFFAEMEKQSNIIQKLGLINGKISTIYSQISKLTEHTESNLILTIEAHIRRLQTMLNKIAIKLQVLFQLGTQYKSTINTINKMLRPEFAALQQSSSELEIADSKTTESTQKETPSIPTTNQQLPIFTKETWRIWGTHGKKTENPVYTVEAQLRRQIKEKVATLNGLLTPPNNPFELSENQIENLIREILSHKQDKSSGGSHFKIKIRRLFPLPFIEYSQQRLAQLQSQLVCSF